MENRKFSYVLGRKPANTKMSQKEFANHSASAEAQILRISAEAQILWIKLNGGDFA